MTNKNIEVYHTENEGKAVMIERFNRTLKSKLWRRFIAQNNQKWLKILPEVVDEYNNKIHRSIQVTPTQASNNPDIIKEITAQNNYENENNPKIPKKPKFKVGDRVRIFKWKSRFEKSAVGYFTNEIFRISKINKTVPITYEIEDLDKEPIIGSFYSSELQATDF